MITALGFGQTALTATTYASFFGTTNGVNDQSEAAGCATYRSGFSISKVQVYVSASTTNSSTTLKVRKNGSDGTVSISIPAGTTGVFSDLVNSDTFATGDTGGYCYSYTGTGTLTIASITALSTPASGNEVYFGIGYISNLFTPNYTAYLGLNGMLNDQTGSGNARTVLRQGGTVSKSQIYITTNTISANSTVSLQKNNGIGNSTMTIPANTTGLFEDTTHSDTLAAGDDVYWKFVSGSGGSQIRSNRLSCLFTSNNANVIDAIDNSYMEFPLTAGGYGGYSAYNETGYNTESLHRTYMPESSTISHSRVYVRNNNSTAAATFVLRKNGSNVTQTFAITGNATGLFEDTTHTDSFAAGDYLTILVSGGTSGRDLICPQFNFLYTTSSATSNNNNLLLLGVG